MAVDEFRVLYIDDNPSDHELVKIYFDVFAQRDYELRCAMTVEEAQSEMSKSEFDLIILDNRIPPDNSFRSTYEKIEGQNFAGPVVVVSANINDPVFEIAPLPDNVMVLDKSDLIEWLKADDFTLRKPQ